jgi:hypothetical protein
VTDPEVQAAIKIISDARQIHVEWAEYLEVDPQNGQDLQPQEATVGGVDHHQKWVTKYDLVRPF